MSDLETSIYILSSEQIQALGKIFRPVQEAALLMTDEEIDEAIAEAVTEVRLERKTAPHSPSSSPYENKRSTLK